MDRPTKRTSRVRNKVPLPNPQALPADIHELGRDIPEARLREQLLLMKNVTVVGRPLTKWIACWISQPRDSSDFDRLLEKLGVLDLIRRRTRCHHADILAAARYALLLVANRPGWRKAQDCRTYLRWAIVSEVLGRRGRPGILSLWETEGRIVGAIAEHIEDLATSDNPGYRQLASRLTSPEAEQPANLHERKRMLRLLSRLTEVATAGERRLMTRMIEDGVRAAEAARREGLPRSTYGTLIRRAKKLIVKELQNPALAVLKNAR